MFDSLFSRERRACTAQSKKSMNRALVRAVGGVIEPLEWRRMLTVLPTSYTQTYEIDETGGVVINSDGEIFTTNNDWTYVAVAVDPQVRSDGRAVIHSLRWQAFEAEPNRTIRSDRTVLQMDRSWTDAIPASDPRTIASVSPGRSSRDAWYLGLIRGLQPFPNPAPNNSFGPYSNINIAFDGPDGNDHLIMRFTGRYTLQVNMNPGASVSGRVFDDRNASFQDDGEPGLSRFVWLDTDRNGMFNGNEPGTISNADGSFVFTNIAPGSYQVRAVVNSGWLGTSNSSSPFVALVNGTTSVTGIQIGQVEPSPVRVFAVNQSTNSPGPRATGNEGGTARFQFTRTNGALPPARVYFNVLGDADASDYQAGALSQGFIDFARGESAKMIDLPLLRNNPAGGERQSGNEQIVIQLDTDPISEGYQNGPIGDYVRDLQGRWVLRPGGSGADTYHYVDPSSWQAVVEIVDMDNKFVTVDTRDAIGFEGSGDLTSFSVYRNGDLSDGLAVQFSLTGTAVADVDYRIQLAGGDGTVTRSGDLLTANFAPGSKELLLTMIPVNDPDREGIEWAHVETLPSLGYTVTTTQNLQQVRMTFVDDEIASVMLRPSLMSPGASRATEAGELARFAVERGGLAYTDEDLLVNFVLDESPSSRTSGDYVLERVNRIGNVETFTVLQPTASGVYSIMLRGSVGGVQEGVVELALRAMDDALPEANKRVEARLISGDYLSHPTLDRVEIVVVDNDRPLVSILSEDPIARETADTATFLLGRGPQGLSQSLTVRYLIDTASTAIFGSDYTLEGPGVSPDGLSVTFAAGADVARLTLRARRDGVSEPSESVVLRLLPMNKYDLGTSTLTPSSATAIIQDPPSGSTYASFDWSMSPRYGIDPRGNGIVDMPNSYSYANPAGGFEVRLDASASVGIGGIANYEWSIYPRSGMQLLQRQTGPDPIFLTRLPEETYQVRLSVTDGVGEVVSEFQLLNVNDLLIVALGDSFSSGEGNPEVSAGNILPSRDIYVNERLPLGRWADGAGEYDDNLHIGAHRSSLAMSSVAAIQIENSDPKSSVTYLNFAQSGAKVFDGLLTPKLDGWDGAPVSPRSQVEDVILAVGSRRIDALILSIGINDIGFSDTVRDYVKRSRLTTLWGFVSLGYSKSLEEIASKVRPKLAVLPSYYSVLRSVLSDPTGLGRNLEPGDVYLVQYPDGPTRGQNGAHHELTMADYGSNIDEFHSLGFLAGLVSLGGATGLFNVQRPLRIDANEGAHAVETVLRPLNDAVSRAASKAGWNTIAAPTEFRYRGYANEPWSWFRTATGSRIMQGGDAYTPAGAMHPNEAGHAAMAGAILNQPQIGSLRDSITVSLPSEISVVEGGVTSVLASSAALQGKFEWDFDYTPGAFNADSFGQLSSFSAVNLSYPASRTIAVRVTDRFGREALASTVVHVTNGVSGRYPDDVQSVNAGEPFRLGLERIRQSADPVNHWRVDWGDGTSELIAGDWAGRSKVYTLLPGESQRTFNYRVWLTDAGGEIEVQGGSVSVVTDDPFPRVSVSTIDATGSERDPADRITFRFTRSGQLNLPLSIAVGVSSGTSSATNGVDFVGPTGLPIPLSVFFPAGQSTVDVVVTVVADANEVEGAENVVVTILPSSLYAVTAATASAIIMDGPSIERGAIAGVVFDDANGNGLRDAGEAALAGWQVALDFDRDGLVDVGEPVATTDAQGRYVHPLQLAGNYQLILMPRAGFVTTLPSAIEAVVLPGETTDNLMFAVARPVSVTGRVFNDQDLDGLLDVGEALRPGVLVYVDQDDDGAFDADEPSDVTGSDGTYSLAGARPGTFVVRAQTSHQWVTTNGIDGGGIAVTATGGASIVGVDHGQRGVPPQLASLTASTGSVMSGGIVTLTATGSDLWTNRVGFYREANGQLGLQTGPGGDEEVGQDSSVGDGWGLTFRAGLDPGEYVFYAAAEDGEGVRGDGRFTSLSVNGWPEATTVGVRALTTAVRENGTLAAAFEVFRRGRNGTALTVALGTTVGTGFTSNGIDHAVLPTTVVIPAGQDSVLIFVGIPDDSLVESQEMVRLGVVSGVGYTTIVGSETADVAVRDASSTPAVVNVLAARLNRSGPMHVVEVALSENVGASLDALETRSLVELGTGRRYSPSELGLEYDPIRGLARFAVPSSGGDGTLPTGQYRLTLTGVVDAIGRPLDGNGDGIGGDAYVFDFVVGNTAVVGREMFYRAASGAMLSAPDKQPLLPGQSSSFANYTSYSRGLNGLFVDIANPAAGLSLSSFEFRIGNTLTPATWALAPAPDSFKISPKLGVNGSHRISITWADNAIRNTWLQVRVLGGSSGLAADDVFYFGNQVGETGDASGVNAHVNATDLSRVLANPRTFRNPASATDPFDINRDRRVDAVDLAIVRDNFASSPISLIMFGVPNGAPAGGPPGSLTAPTPKPKPPESGGRPDGIRPPRPPSFPAGRLFTPPGAPPSATSELFSPVPIAFGSPGETELLSSTRRN